MVWEQLLTASGKDLDNIQPANSHFLFQLLLFIIIQYPMVHHLFCLKPLTGVPSVLGFIQYWYHSPWISAVKVIFHPPCIEWHWLGLRGDVWIFPTGQDLPLPSLLFHPPPDPPPSSYLCTFFSIVQIDVRIFKYALYCCILAPDIKPCHNFYIKLYSTPASYHYWESLCSVALHKCFILGHNYNGTKVLRQEHFPSLSILPRSMFGVRNNVSGWLKAK